MIPPLLVFLILFFHPTVKPIMSLLIFSKYHFFIAFSGNPTNFINLFSDILFFDKNEYENYNIANLEANIHDVFMANSSL